METNLAQIQPRTERRISLARVALSILVVCGAGFGAATTLADWHEAQTSGPYAPWFAAYVDVTSTPTYTFEKRASVTESDDVMLAFIVASPSAPCTPTWGGYYSMSEAASAIDLDRRIARLQQQGGRIALSFGGLRNTELAVGCTDADALSAAYRSVIERYHVNTVDFDLENEGLTNVDALSRRAKVIAALQDEYRKEGKSLAVWLTLPVTPQGLTKEGTDAVAAMLAGEVDLAGINVMAMDYGPSLPADESMFEGAKEALTETHRQLGILYGSAGVSLNSASLWKKLGVTPMLGQNDISDEVFTADDAVALNDFGRQVGLGRMSLWSANRDIPCGENYVDVKVVSDVCSGVKSPTFAFTQALAKGFEGNLVQNASLITVDDPDSNKPTVDDPEKSPYQIWQGNAVYLKGTKVVWHGNVYEAKWWTKNDYPDNPVLQAAETPWQLVGPVLPGDKPVKILSLPPGTYPIWQGQAIYNEGDRVLLNGVAYEAKWWTQGESPATAAANPDNSPWLPLSQAQISAILQGKSI